MSIQEIRAVKAALLWSRYRWDRETLGLWGKTPVAQVKAISYAIHDIEKEMEMAKKALNMPVKEKQETLWRGFVNVRLTDAQKAQFEAWDVHDGDLFDAIAGVLAGGYKVSLGYNERNDTFSASITGTAAAGSNSGYTVSSFARDAYNALRVVVFKVTQVLPTDWTTFESAAEDLYG